MYHTSSILFCSYENCHQNIIPFLNDYHSIEIPKNIHDEALETPEWRKYALKEMKPLEKNQM